MTHVILAHPSIPFEHIIGPYSWIYNSVLKLKEETTFTILDKRYKFKEAIAGDEPDVDLMQKVINEELCTLILEKKESLIDPNRVNFLILPYLTRYITPIIEPLKHFNDIGGYESIIILTVNFDIANQTLTDQLIVKDYLTKHDPDNKIDFVEAFKLLKDISYDRGKLMKDVNEVFKKNEFISMGDFKVHILELEALAYIRGVNTSQSLENFYLTEIVQKLIER